MCNRSDETGGILDFKELAQAYGQTVDARFIQLIAATPCPFARSTRFMPNVLWQPNSTIKDNAVAAAYNLSVFVHSFSELHLDMFVLEVRDHPAVRDIYQLKLLLYEIIDNIACSDPFRTCHFTDGITTNKWDFVFMDERFFVPVFAPFYPHNHPRCSHVDGSVFIVFQLDHSFKRRGISSTNDDRLHLTEEVANCFHAQSYSYSIEMVTHPLKAARYIKPVDLSDTPIIWWDNASC